ncbi:hypothetical protein ACIRVK_32200 [Streptomyces sp. NPDC101152]|uniref:hypothetical protein n=1 Tax=Streptomyces sp. NPDC101152 TaxID=3366116 RepID=UPI003807F0E7
MQDHLLRRSYRVELLRPVGEPRVLKRSGKNLRRRFDVVRRMALEAYPPCVRDGLRALTRLRAHLLEEGHLDSLVELARRTQGIRPEVSVEDIRWRDGKLHLTTVIGMRRADGGPLTPVERYGRMLLDPDLLAGIEDAEGWEAPHPLGHAHGELVVHDLWWYPDADLTPRTQPLGGGRHRVVLTGEKAGWDAGPDRGEPEAWAGPGRRVVARNARPAAHTEEQGWRAGQTRGAAAEEGRAHGARTCPHEKTRGGPRPALLLSLRPCERTRRWYP